MRRQRYDTTQFAAVDAWTGKISNVQLTTVEDRELPSVTVASIINPAIQNRIENGTYSMCEL